MHEIKSTIKNRLHSTSNTYVPAHVCGNLYIVLEGDTKGKNLFIKIDSGGQGLYKNYIHIRIQENICYSSK